jgi:uncharacterized protein (UPF0332 family)
VNGLWKKALAAADDARLLHAAGRYDAAANRAYYAMYNAARALLVARGLKPADMKRHATVQNRFWRLLVEDGPFDEEDSLALRRAGDTRAAADYDTVPVTKEKAGATLASMERFLSTAQRAREDTPTGHTP